MKRLRYKRGRVEKSARKNTSDVWVYRWSDRGTERSRIVGTVKDYPTKSAALKAAEYLKLKVNEDAFEPATFGAVIHRYKAEELPERFSTRHAYESYLKKHILPKWETVPLAEVKPHAVEQWLKNLNLAPKSKVHIRNLMKLLFDCAMRWEFIDVQLNPMSLVRVKGGTKRLEEPKVLTLDEFLGLVAALEEPFKTMVLLDGCTGLRASELCGLRWSDFNWGALTFKVQRGVVAGRIGEVKTRYSKAEMPLTVELAEVLLRWKEKTEFSAENDWVFTSPFENKQKELRPYSSWGVQQRHVKPAAIRLGLGPIGWHTFRHCYRSWLDATGAPMAVQQELMRHASISTTMNVYGRAMAEPKRKAQESLVGRIFKK